MIFKNKYIIIFLFIFITALILRIYQVDKIPPGLNIDESSEAYNAFSLLHTGKDRYGESFPILFRSFGSFQAPLYTYLSVIPVLFLGNTIIAIRLVSIISGVALVIITFLLLRDLSKVLGGNIPLIAALFVAISPWSIFFTRFGTEASLGLMLFSLSILIFYQSLTRPWLFTVGSLILGISTHAYYSQRLLSVLFLLGFILLFRRKLWGKWLILGLILFFLTQVPHLAILNSGAFTRRISQVDYFSYNFFQNNSGELRLFPFGRQIFIVREFFSQYFAYLSPRNLFFDPDPNSGRSIPDLSVFYDWMIVPFIVGISIFAKKLSLPIIRILTLTLLIAPIPAALTRDPFHTIRALDLFWVLTIIITIGVNHIVNKFKKIQIRYALVFFLFLYSLFTLYISYFVLMKYERAIPDYVYTKLLDKIREYPEKEFIVDSSRQLANGVRFAYFTEYDPYELQKHLRSRLGERYYSSFEIEEYYKIGNIEAKAIVWEEDLCKGKILVGDLLAISDEQVKEHHLIPLFEVKDLAGNVTLRGYETGYSACKAIR